MPSPYFSFDLDHQGGAVSAACVEEILALPELTLIPEAPLGIVGVIDFRGEILPVMDLQARDSQEPQRYRLSDTVIVLNHGTVKVGVLVTAVQGLREIPEQAMAENPADPLTMIKPELRRLLSPVLVDDTAILLLRGPQDWFNLAEIQQFISATSFLMGEIQAGVLQNTFHQAIAPEDAPVFRQRAENLRPASAEDQAAGEAKTFVVLALGDTLLGIDSHTVREFITLQQATPVPCCPPHIVGSINLRGEVVTVVDIRQFLQLPAAELAEAPKVAILELAAMTIGVVVDDVRDAMFSTTQDLKAASTVTASADYLLGEVAYSNQIMRVLNLSSLLSDGALVVNDVL